MRLVGDSPRLERVLVLVVASVAIVTVAGIVILWPRGEAPAIGSSAADFDYVKATVTEIDVIECMDPAVQIDVHCQRATFLVTSGVTAGDTGTFLRSQVDLRTQDFEVGDRVVLSYNPLAPLEFRYVFFEFQRDAPLIVLAFLFVLVVVAFGRWQGVRALVGLAISLGVVMMFLLPSLLRGNNALAVALVATAAIAFAALYLAHGVSIATSVALVGTLSSVLLITFLSAIFSKIARLTGLADESLQVLSITAEAVDPRGVLVAGIVIGALGVLDDVTVTQVSAVAEIRHADPKMPAGELYASAIRIGRDHVASTVNTLVLAYVGAALALILFYFQESRPLSQVFGQEIVAIEIVRMLIGSMGLVLAVPITTGLAVLVAGSGHLDVIHAHGPHAGHFGDTANRDHAPAWEDFAPREKW